MRRLIRFRRMMFSDIRRLIEAKVRAATVRESVPAYARRRRKPRNTNRLNREKDSPAGASTSRHQSTLEIAAGFAIGCGHWLSLCMRRCQGGGCPLNDPLLLARAECDTYTAEK